MVWSTTERFESCTHHWPFTITITSPRIVNEQLEFIVILTVGSSKISSVNLPLVDTLVEAQKLAVEWAKTEILNMSRLIE